MKKLFTLILSLLSLNIAYATVEQTQWDTYWDDETQFYFIINDDNTATITSYKNTKVTTGEYNSEDRPSIVIPKEIDGHTVTAIGNGAFYGCTNIRSFTFEDGCQVKKIMVDAIKNCTGFTSFTVPATVETIGDQALSGGQWTSITFETPSKLDTISDTYALQYNAFESIEFPEGLKYIGTACCVWETGKAGAGARKKVVLPSTVTYIGGQAFLSKNDKMESVICRAIVPPTLGNKYVFYTYDCDTLPHYNSTDYYNGIATNITYEVPDGSYYLYKEDEMWGVYFTDEAEKESNSVLVGNPITDDYGNSYYFYYTNEENKEIELELYAIADGTTNVTIPAEVNGYAVSKINDGVFSEDILASLKSVTFESATPICDASIFEGIAEGAVLYVDNYQATYANAGWHDYFTIYGYVEKDDQFSDNTFKYTVLEDTNNVEITELANSDATSITINQNVSYNGLSLTVVSIADDVFKDKTVDVTVTFENPNAISFNTLSSTLTDDAKIGTLYVPVDTQEGFNSSAWANYFTISNFSEGTIFTDNGLTYQVKSIKDVDEANESTVIITAFDCTESVTIPVTVNGFDVIGVDGVGEYTNESETNFTPVFACDELKYVTIEAEEPPFSVEAFESIAENDPVLYVGDNISAYTSTDTETENWHEYFTIYGYVEAGDTFNYGDLYYQVQETLDSPVGNQASSTNPQVTIIANESYASLESIVIPTSFEYNGLTFTVTSIADNAFANAELLTSVTVSSEELITLGTNAFAKVDGAILYANGLQDVYAGEGASWSDYFTIYQYVVSGETFTVDQIVYTVDNDDLTTVAVTGVEDNVNEITLVTSVDYNGLTFTVTSIVDEAFNDLTELDVTVKFNDPSAIELSTIATLTDDNKLGTLTAPAGYRDFFKDTQYDWGKYFDIADIPYVSAGVNYYFQTNRTATVDSFNTDTDIVLTDNVVGFSVQTIAEQVFADAYEANGNELLAIQTSVVDPLAIQLADRSTTEPEYYGTLVVPDGAQNIYKQTTWAEYFDFGGEDYLTTDGLVYYTFIITYVDDDSDDNNKALKATSSKYSISLEVAYVDESATDVTIPRTIDLGDDSLYDTYEVTSLNGSAFKDCKDLVSVTLEAAIPVEDADALNYVPESCVIVVEDDATKQSYSAVLSGVTILTEEEYKAINTAVQVVVDTPSTGAVSEKQETARYNILGQRITAPVHGINIIHFSDGTVLKVLVK